MNHKSIALQIELKKAIAALQIGMRVPEASAEKVKLAARIQILACRLVVCLCDEFHTTNSQQTRS